MAIKNRAPEKPNSTIHRLFLMVLPLLMLFSCIDSRYDIENVSNKMHLFENGIYFPLLKERLPFGKMLSENDDIMPNEKGVFSMSTEWEEFLTGTEEVPNILLPSQTLVFNEGGKVSFSLDRSEEKIINFPNELTTFTAHLLASSDIIDDRIIAVNTAKLNPVADVVINIGLKSSPGIEVSSISFYNYRIELPNDIVVGTPRTLQGVDVTIDDNNIITLNGTSIGEMLVLSVPVAGLKDISVNTSRKIVIEKDVKMSSSTPVPFSCKIKNVSGSYSSFSLQMSPDLYIPEIIISDISGKVDLELTPVIKTVSVGNIPSFLEAEGTQIHLLNSVILLNFDNPLSIPFIASVGIKTRDASGNYIRDENGDIVNVVIPNMEIREAGESKIYISDMEDELYKTLGYSFVHCADIYKISVKIPSSLEIEFDGHNDKTKYQNIELGKKYSADINCKADIPLMLESGSCFSYTEERSGLYDKAFQYFSAKEVYINSVFVNRFPAQIEVLPKIFDKSGEEIKEVELKIFVDGKEDNIIKPSQTTAITPDIQPEKTDMRIRLFETTPGRINQIDRIDFMMNIKFYSPSAITKYQDILMDFVLDAPYGVGIVRD